MCYRNLVTFYQLTQSSCYLPLIEGVNVKLFNKVFNKKYRDGIKELQKDKKKGLIKGFKGLFE